MEGLRDLPEVLRVDLDELQPVLLGEAGPLLQSHCPLVLQVVLIPDQQDLHVRVAVDFHLLQPVLYMGKSIPAGDIVDQQGSDRAPVVGSGDRPEVLLARSVPDLQLYVFVPHFYRFCPELHADRYVVGRTHFIFDELEHHAGLADPRVADHDELE